MAHNIPETVPLKPTVWSNKDGSPLRTPLADRYPLISRRNRRMIDRELRKAASRAKKQLNANN